MFYGQSSGPVEPFDPGRLSGITGTGRGAGSLTLRWVAASHYLLSQAAEAHARLASRAVSGKILLEV